MNTKRVKAVCVAHQKEPGDNGHWTEHGKKVVPTNIHHFKNKIKKKKITLADQFSQQASLKFLIDAELCSSGC